MRTLLLLALSAAVVPAPPQSQAPEPDLRAVVAEAIRSHQAGELEAAIEGYRTFLAARPEVVDVRSNLAAALSATGRYDEALGEYRKALQVEPARADVRFNLAAALYKADRAREAADELKRVLAQDSTNRNAAVLLAECHARYGEYPEAIALLEPLRERLPDDRAVTYLLGMALLRDDQVERGRVLLDEILRHGESAQTWLLLGVMKLQANEYADAREDLEKAAALGPDLPLVHGFLGKTYMNTGEVLEAQQAFRRELEINPNDFDASLHLGVLLKQENRLEEAMERFRHAERVRPGDPAALYQVGALELQQGDADEARQILERVVSAAPDFMEAHVSLATAFYRLKRKEDGDRHRSIARELRQKQQEEQPGAQVEGEAYRGQPQPGAEAEQEGSEASRPGGASR